MKVQNRKRQLIIEYKPMKNNLLLRIVAFSFIVLMHQISPAQDEPGHRAPTLQVGLSGLSFNRGDLDAALVAEIIAEKQKEVKIKLVKNMLLKKLQLDNGLFYAFIDQNIEILLTEKDEDTRVKNLLENIVNLAFVVSYAEYYVSSIKPNTTEWTNLKNLAEAMGVDGNLFAGPKLSLLDFARVKPLGSSSGKTLIKNDTPESYQRNIRNKFVGVLLDLFAEVVRQNPSLKTLGVLRTNYLQNYSSMNSYLQLKDERVNPALLPLITKLQGELNLTGYPQQILIMEKIRTRLKTGVDTLLTEADEKLASGYAELLKNSVNKLTVAIDKLPEDEKVFGFAYNENYQRARGTGLFTSIIKTRYSIDIQALTPNQKKQWSWLYRYLEAEFKLQFFEGLLNKKSVADVVFADVAHNLSIHVKYFNLIKSFAAKGNNFDSVATKLSTEFSCGDVTTYLGNMRTSISSARTSIRTLTQLTIDEKRALEKVGDFMDQLRYVKLNRYEYMRRYEEEIRPGLISLSKYSEDFMEAGRNMEGVVNCILKSATDELKSININLNPSFIDLFTRLDEFNKVETFAQFVNHLSDAGDLFSDEEMRKSINKVLTFVRSYLKVVDDENGKMAITLDVEGFLLNMQRIPYNRWRPFSLHFTVGANTTFFNSDLVLPDASTLRNYSFIGEKIGVKFKLYDWKYLNSFSKGETFTYRNRLYVRNTAPHEPVISNIHLLAYGSGLLYNLVNTGNTSNFNSPLLGIGLGITFFNDLDFNLSVGTPLVKDKSFRASGVPDFFSIGFDIQFIEYYNRLQQKRRANQTQKKLSEAAKKS